MLRPGTKVVGRPFCPISIAMSSVSAVPPICCSTSSDNTDPSPRRFAHCGKARAQRVEHARARVKFDHMALAIVETHRLDGLKSVERPGEAGGGILAAGKKDEGVVFVHREGFTAFWDSIETVCGVAPSTASRSPLPRKRGRKNGARFLSFPACGGGGSPCEPEGVSVQPVAAKTRNFTRAGGMSIETVVPSPSALSMETAPPWSSTSALQMDRPSPAPSKRRARLLSSCLKG